MRYAIPLVLLLTACGEAVAPQPMPEFTGPCAPEMTAVWVERGQPRDTVLTETAGQSYLEWFYPNIVEIFVWHSDDDFCVRGRAPTL